MKTVVLLQPNLKVRLMLPRWHSVTDTSTEVDRALDNLVKSGKFYAGGGRPMGAMRPGSEYGE